MSMSITTAQKRVADLKNDIAHWMGKIAHLHVYSFEQMQAYRMRILGDETYKKLPKWAQAEVYTVMRVYDELHDKKLLWSHVLDDVRIPIHDPRSEGRHKEISEQNPSISCFCYVANIMRPTGPTQRVFIPYMEKDRKLEIESGRITQLDIEAVIDPYRNNAKVELLIPEYISSPFVKIGTIEIRS